MTLTVLNPPLAKIHPLYKSHSLHCHKFVTNHALSKWSNIQLYRTVLGQLNYGSVALGGHWPDGLVQGCQSGIMDCASVTHLCSTLYCSISGLFCWTHFLLAVLDILECGPSTGWWALQLNSTVFVLRLGEGNTIKAQKNSRKRMLFTFIYCTTRL